MAGANVCIILVLLLLSSESTVLGQLSNTCPSDVNSTELCTVEQTSFQMPNVATLAECMPRDTVVYLYPDNQTISSDTFVSPLATRVKRCPASSCMRPRHRCMTTQYQTRLFKIQASNLEPSDTQVSVPEHTECGCKCTLSEDDCGHQQNLDKQQCRCVCNNEHLETLCRLRTDRTWNAPTCSCGCKQIRHCNPGSTFNFATCRCKANGARIDFAAVPLAKTQAICYAQPTIVTLQPDRSALEANQVFVETRPSCTRTMRCVGCLKGFVRCVPKDTELISYRATAILFDTKTYEKKKLSFTTEIENHLSCGVQCSITQSDCTSEQKFEPKECACVCVNFDAWRFCHKIKHGTWDPINCACVSEKLMLDPSGVIHN